jgi:hypothetical protein
MPCMLDELVADLFMGGGGGGGFLALDGGGGGAVFFPFENPAFSVVELADLDGALPVEVAGDAERSPYDRSGLLLLWTVESSE